MYFQTFFPAVLLAFASASMPVAELKPEFVSSPVAPAMEDSNSSYFVFLQKFPLPGGLFFHTEVLVCARNGFPMEDQQFLDKQIAGMKDFEEIEESWWNTRTANCVELGYGGADCSKECCSAPHTQSQLNYPLNKRAAVIGNANTKKKSLYIYGTGGFSGDVAYHNTCDKKCWSNWAGTDYNPLKNNCNTFTSTVLAMVYGLSQKKPHLGVSDMVTVHGHCPTNGVSETMPIVELKPEFVSSSVVPALVKTNSSYFVFLQKFPLPGGLFFHTEVLVCAREGFAVEDQQFLDKEIAGMKDFAEIEESWWNTRTANCVELGYGGADCSKECCGAPHTQSQLNYPLNKRAAVIGNANTDKKSLYIYGTGDFDGDVAYHNTCDKKCWSNWAGTDYNPLKNNCNTFTSTVLAMVYGLSQKKPHLGVSDMVTVHGHCPSTDFVVV